MKNFNFEKQTQIESGFKVPDGYFDDFSEKIMTQINNETNSQNPRVISLFDRNKKWMLSIAASFVVLFSMGYFFYNSNINKSESSEMEQYIVTNSTITDEDIASLLNQNDIQKISIEYNLKHNSTENLDLENLDLEENL